MALVYSASAGGFRNLQLQEVGYLIKSTTVGANNNIKRQKKRNSMQGQTNFANIIEVES